MYRCGNETKPESQWQGENINRFCEPTYDALLDELGQTGDLAKRGEIAIKLNNMLTKDSYTIVPLVHLGRVSAHAKSLGGVILNTWDSELWNVADWHRIKQPSHQSAFALCDTTTGSGHAPGQKGLGKQPWCWGMSCATH